MNLNLVCAGFARSRAGCGQLQSAIDESSSSEMEYALGMKAYPREHLPFGIPQLAS
jgi:rhodanese-related sulfurtransferase